MLRHEVDVLKLKGDCDRLRGKKRALEECVTEQAAKRICLEEKLKTALEKSQKKDEESKRRFKSLAKKVADMCLEKNVKRLVTSRDSCYPIGCQILHVLAILYSSLR